MTQLDEWFAVRHEERDRVLAALNALNSPADSVTSKRMEREQVTDMIAASEARTDTKFERVLSEMRLMRASAVGKTTFFLGGIALFAAIVTVMAYGGQWFSNGLGAEAIAKSAAQQALAARH